MAEKRTILKAGDQFQVYVRDHCVEVCSILPVCGCGSQYITCSVTFSKECCRSCATVLESQLKQIIREAIEREAEHG